MPEKFEKEKFVFNSWPLEKPPRLGGTLRQCTALALVGHLQFKMVESGGLWGASEFSTPCPYLHQPLEDLPRWGRGTLLVEVRANPNIALTKALTDPTDFALSILKTL